MLDVWPPNFFQFNYEFCFCTTSDCPSIHLKGLEVLDCQYGLKKNVHSAWKGFFAPKSPKNVNFALNSGPQNRFFGDSAMNIASFTTAGPLSIQLKELVAFICQYGPKTDLLRYEEKFPPPLLPPPPPPVWPPSQPLPGRFEVARLHCQTKTLKLHLATMIFHLNITKLCGNYARYRPKMAITFHYRSKKISNCKNKVSWQFSRESTLISSFWEEIHAENGSKFHKIVENHKKCSFRATTRRDPGWFCHFWPQIRIPHGKIQYISFLKSKVTIRSPVWRYLMLPYWIFIKSFPAMSVWEKSVR